MDTCGLLACWFFLQGLNVVDGKVVYAAVAELFGLPYHEASILISGMGGPMNNALPAKVGRATITGTHLGSGSHGKAGHSNGASRTAKTHAVGGVRAGAQHVHLRRVAVVRPVAAAGRTMARSGAASKLVRV